MWSSKLGASKLDSIGVIHLKEQHFRLLSIEETALIRCDGLCLLN